MSGSRCRVRPVAGPCCDNGGGGMNPKILTWIEKEQSGKPGIYPHKLAETVAHHWNITIQKAMQYVTQHIQDVMDGLMEAEG